MSSKKSDSSVKTALKQFGETTSFKGIPRLMKARSPAIRIVWVVAIFIGVGFGTYQIISMIIQYFAYKVGYMFT